MLSVVPIFMSAGAAALPTLLAAVTSVVAVILKPREFLRACRRRPKVVGAVAGLAIASGFALWWLLAESPARAVAAGADSRAPSAVDWIKVATDIINQEKSGKRPTAIVLNTTEMPLVLGYDYSRCSFGGGASPLDLRPNWTFRPFKKSMFLSAPAVAGKRTYVAGCITESGIVGMLACVDTGTGQALWQITQVGDDLLQPFFSSPALTQDGKFLLIGEGLHESHDCALRCFDAATGQMRWAVQTTLHIESSPAIFGDTVVVGAGAIEGEDGKATGDPGHVIAVRISDGKELWRQPVNDPESSPAIDADGTVFIGSGFNGSALVALRSIPDDELHQKKLERILWRTPVEQPVTSAITLAGDLVIAGAGNSDFVNAAQHPRALVIAIERASGKIRWQTRFEDAVLGTIAVRDGKLICAVRTGEVAALDLNDGRILWRTPISGKAPVLAGCAFTGKLIYAVSSDGYLAVLDPKDGKLLEKTYLNDQALPSTGKSLSPPVVVQGRLIVGSETGGLRSFLGARSAE